MNYEGMTNAEAVAYYLPITTSPIPCGDLENLLGWAGKAKRNAVSGAWEGSLIDFMDSNAVPALSEGLGELFSHLNKPRSVSVDTNLQPWAGKMADLLAGLEAVGQVDAAFTADVVALAGGHAHEGLVEDDIQALRDEDAARLAFDANIQRYNELYNIHIASLPANSDASAWAAALLAMSNEFVVVE